MKRFLKSPGGIDQYGAVQIEWIFHHNPELTVTDSVTNEQVTYDLSKYHYDDLHKLMRRLNFPSAASSPHPPEVAAQRAAHAAADSDGAFRSRSERLPAHNDVPPADAALLRQDGADEAQPVSVLSSSSSTGLKAFINDAIAAGDDVLALGLMHEGRGGQRMLTVVSLVIVGALVATAAHCSGMFPLRTPASRQSSQYAIVGASDADRLEGGFASGASRGAGSNILLAAATARLEAEGKSA